MTIYTGIIALIAMAIAVLAVAKKDMAMRVCIVAYWILVTGVWLMRVFEECGG